MSSLVTANGPQSSAVLAFALDFRRYRRSMLKFWKKKLAGETPEPPAQGDEALVEEAAEALAAETIATTPLPSAEPATPGKRSWRERLSGSGFAKNLGSLFSRNPVLDDVLLDELEGVLISADVGVTASAELVDDLRKRVARREFADATALLAALRADLVERLKPVEKPLDVGTRKPFVLLMVGVNGVGKTTTIGKLAQRIKAEGNDVLICAADTFRAAASDQLAIWAERTGVPLIQQKQGTDPAAVLFDSMKAAKARGSDVLIVDTAGRLHNKSNLMAELEKMKRVASREVEGAPHETLLVVDAVTGQNGLEQARQFLKVAGVTGIVLTKLDGTAKGGIAVAIAKELGLPIRYAGIGEKVDDLVVFDAEQYVNSLFN